MRILGIDPGTATTGWGVIEKQSVHQLTVLAYGCVTTKPHQPLSDRIEAIYDQIINLARAHQPEILAIEKVFFNTNAKTAMSVGQASGAVLLAGKKSQLSIQEYTPLQVKIAVTGYGRAEKYQVQKMVQTLLKLKDLPKPDDAADALAVAITCAFSVLR